MTRAINGSLVLLSAGAAAALGLAGCQTAPVQTAGDYASTGAQGAYTAASSSAHVVYETGGDVYSGISHAAQQPLRDFNVVQDPIAPVLLRAELKPYDAEGLTSCAAILNKVAELDLALGPDIDTPVDKRKNRVDRDAGFVSDAALDAASTAAEGFLPMRSVVKRITGATRYEQHVARARLAGEERRAFLKAIGMEHNCAWPAAPLGFQPVIAGATTAPVALTTTPLSVPAPPAEVVAISSTPLAVPSATVTAAAPSWAPSPAGQPVLVGAAFTSAPTAPWSSTATSVATPRR